MHHTADRRNRLRERLQALHVDGMLITEPHNVRYLTNFTGDSSYLLMTTAGGIILSDRRYEEQLAHECPDLELAIRGPAKTMHQLCIETIGDAAISRLAVEEDHLAWSMVKRFMQDLMPKELVGVSGEVEALRRRKDATELEILRRAVQLAETAYEQTIAELRPDWTELDVAWRLEHWVRQGGGEKLGFPAIVAVGSNAALPHYHPGRRKLSEHPLLLIDWGARLDGYTSDLTRTVRTGEVDLQLQRIHQVVREAHDAAIDVVAPGIPLADVDAAARKTIERAGFGEYFSHGLGHGIGLQIHEYPRMAAGQPGVLEAGMVITIEPGIYIPGVGGVRIEDDCLVTEEGREVLSRLGTGLEAVA